MGIWQSIVKWFIKQVWPEIQALIIRFTMALFEWIFERILDLLTRSRTREEESAWQKANAEERKAEQSSAPQDAECHRRIAQVWREVAESLRQENEKLRDEMGKLLSDAKNDAETSISSLTVENIFEIENDKLKLKADLRPSLPLPATKRWRSERVSGLTPAAADAAHSAAPLSCCVRPRVDCQSSVRSLHILAWYAAPPSRIDVVYLFG